MKKAVVLLSGGMDSAVTLYIAKRRGYTPYCLTFDYGQLHKKEVRYAKKIADLLSCDIKVLKIRLPWGHSALLDPDIKIPEKRDLSKKGIPPTYVPARNTIFLSFAVSYAEAIGAKAIFIGANSIDFSGYPDCRPRYYDAFNRLLRTATKEKGIRVIVPLLYKTKQEIVNIGKRLGVDFNLTWSCYKGEKRPCGVCDACILRERGFITY